MIRKASPADLEGIYNVLRAIGNERKDPRQGFLIADYSRNEESYRRKYAIWLQELDYKYVYLEEKEIKAFLLAYRREEWLREVPQWLKDVIWHPCFDQSHLENFVLINQTAMYPELTGKGVGSRLYQALFADMVRDGIKDVFAETVIAPVPNFASLNFRLKQKYNLAGIRYEEMAGTILTTLVYHKTTGACGS